MERVFVSKAAENAVDESADESVAAADAVENVDRARLDYLPFVAREHDGAPKVLVRVHDLAKRRREDLRVREFLLYAADHAFKAVDLRRDVLAARLRPFDAEAKLEVLFVADENVGNGGDLREYLAQFLFSSLPERRAVVKVE